MSRAPQDQSDDHRGPSPLGSREEHSFCNAGHPFRSEEHTSELQSHSDLVCRLLLEKKKQRGQAMERARFATLSPSGFAQAVTVRKSSWRATAATPPQPSTATSHRIDTSHARTQRSG